MINNSTNFSANLDHFLKISFDKTYKVNDFTYTNKGLVEELFLKFEKPVKNSFIEKNINNLSFKKSELSSRYSSDKKNYINAKGVYSVDNQKYQNYNFDNYFSNKEFNINLNFEFAKKLNIDFLN